MPFDSAPERPQQAKTVYERLCILRELLPGSGDQLHWASCLWSAARRDQRLATTGDRQPTGGDAALFGPQGWALFSDAPKGIKAEILDAAISEAAIYQQAVDRGLPSPYPPADTRWTLLYPWPVRRMAEEVG